MGESPFYIGKMEGDFINNRICIYNFFGKSITILYYLVKSWWITSTKWGITKKSKGCFIFLVPRGYSRRNYKVTWLHCWWIGRVWLITIKHATLVIKSYRSGTNSFCLTISFKSDSAMIIEILSKFIKSGCWRSIVNGSFEMVVFACLKSITSKSTKDYIKGLSLFS